MTASREMLSLLLLLFDGGLKTKKKEGKKGWFLLSLESGGSTLHTAILFFSYFILKQEARKYRTLVMNFGTIQ